MEKLFLADLINYSYKELIEHIHFLYHVDRKILDKYEIIIAFEESTGHDDSIWFLLKEKATGDFYIIQSSQCACYGFEGIFKPEKTSIDYLKSDKFNPRVYDDDNDNDIDKKIIDFINKIFGGQIGK